MRSVQTALLLAATLTVVAGASAQEAPSAPTRLLLDRVVVRWSAPETGGSARPQFVLERELSFEARLESLAEREPENAPILARHIRAALDRHIAEVLLSSLPIEEAPTPADVARRAEAARSILEQRVHGRARLIAAAKEQGLSSDELDSLLRRQARASLYIDRMIAPMLEPSEGELREAYRTGNAPFQGRFEDVVPLVRQWYVAQRVGQAIETYYQNARTRIRVVLVRGR